MRARLVAVVVGCVLAALLPAVAVLSSGASTGAAPVAAFPGDNGLIAFASDRGGNQDIWVVSPDGGSGARRLLGTSATESEPAWSPDGTRVVFVRSDGEGGSALFVADRDGSGERRLTDDGDVDGEPAWSPGGDRIVFESSRGDRSSQLWVVDADGGDPELLVPEPDEGLVFDPSWSPDGQQIAYAAGIGEGGSAALYVVDVADPGNPTQITFPESEDHRHPDWSPDGRRIVFAAQGDGSANITTVAADGSDEHRLTTGTDDDWPSWSPDGTAIVFSREVAVGSDVDEQLWTMDADGSDEVQLTSPVLPAGDRQPSWGPVPTPDRVEVTPESAAHDVGDETTVTASATDAAGDPIEGAQLLLRITGAHPQTRRLRTDADGEATYTWESTRAGTDSVLVCADPDGDDACDPEDPAATATVLWSAPAVDEPRLAFTDDVDALQAFRVDRDSVQPQGLIYTQSTLARSYESPVTRWTPGPSHEGEAAGIGGDSPVFVSTRDDPNGEVYQVVRGSPTRRVTCDPGSESHPVVNESGAIAYASDADGDWDIYVSSPPPDPGPGRPAPFGRSAVATASSRASAPSALAQACDATWTTVNVTDEPDGAPVADELWPTWTYTGDTSFAGSGFASGLAFSRAAEGELPDLYSVAGTGPVFGPPVALTSTPDVAETQPAGMALQVRIAQAPEGCEGFCTDTYGSRGWVAYTTSALRSAGTIALVATDGSGQTAVPEDRRFQGGEPAWSDVINPTHLAITTTEDDPYADIAIAEVREPIEGDAGALDATVDGFRVVNHGATGVSQSHPFWLDGYDDSEDTQATLVVTSSNGDVEDDSRRLQADVSDVRALDGTQRRVIRRQRTVEDGQVVFRFDEAGPSYSPDGRNIVYSRFTGPEDGREGDRVLMVADADGANPARLLPPGLRGDADLDVDPVWSPDGNRIAFVRITGRDRIEAPSDPPEVYVYDLAAGTLTRIPGAGGDDPSADLSPSWAPDSTHLVLSRTYGGPGGNGNPNDAARGWQYPAVGVGGELVVVDATRPNDPAVRFDYCSDSCSVYGRSPAWSSDGTRIAYDYDGELRTVALEDPCCPSGVIRASEPVTLVGGDDDGTGLTASRTVVSSAQDPAWSPDDTEIAFTGQPVGQPDRRGIYRIDADGTGVRVFTDEPGPESEPAWQNRRESDLAVTVSIAGSPAMVDQPVVATFTVTNLGPRPAPLVSLDTTFSPGAATTAPGAPAGCRADGTGCDLATLASGASFVYKVRVRHGERTLGVATGTVSADAPDPDLTNNTASAPYRVMGADVAVDIRLDAPIGYVGGHRTATVVVRNVGVDPVEGVEVRATWTTLVVPGVPDALPPPAPPVAPPCLVAGTACALGTINPGGRRAYRVDLLTNVEGATELVAEVSTSTMQVDVTNDEDVVALEVLQPELRVLPSVAPPGKVVLAYGEKFPPGSRVTLRWKPGINVIRGAFRVDADGTLRVPVLVVRHDLLGQRVLVARSRTRLFSDVTADLLVVPRTLSPPSFNGRG